MKVETRNVNWSLEKEFTSDTVIETANNKIYKGIYVDHFYYANNENAKTWATNETIGIWRVKKLNK